MPNLFASIFVNSRAVSPVRMILPDVPPWLEAGLVGMLLGIYFGFLCAMLYRARARRTVNVARAKLAAARAELRSRRRTMQPAMAAVTVPGSHAANVDIHAIDAHMHSLTQALGDDVTAEWRLELRRQQERLIRLHQALE